MTISRSENYYYDDGMDPHGYNLDAVIKNVKDNASLI